MLIEPTEKNIKSALMRYAPHIEWDATGRKKVLATTKCQGCGEEIRSDNDLSDTGEWVDTNGKKHKESDSPRYKALGNSIAVPFWEWMAGRMAAFYDRPATMGSLFDGIGGFPLAYERNGVKAVWASEIEEFPIAVTKKHFPEEEDES